MFHTNTKNGLTILTADTLSGVCHGFSTRPGGVSPAPWDSLNLGVGRGDEIARVQENYRRFCAALGTDVNRVVLSKQIHEDVVRHVTEADAGKGLWRDRDYPSVDGMVTDVLHLPLVVFSADCNVVLLHDPVRKAIGACHAGWRGTALGIAAKTARRMAEVYGTDPADLHCAIGPGISRCCFETRADVPEAVRAALGDAAADFIDDHGDGSFHVDLKGINRWWLRSVGVPPEQIEVCQACTACDLNTFFSHRRMGTARGAMAAIIELT